jgi:hypothetical protein
MIFVFATCRLFHNGCLFELFDEFGLKCYACINSHTESSDDGNRCNDGEASLVEKKKIEAEKGQAHIRISTNGWNLSSQAFP